MLEMSDEEYRDSSLLDLVVFVLRVPLAPALRQRTLSAWLLSIAVTPIYYGFAAPLVVGSIVVLLSLMTPMLLIALVMRLVGLWREPHPRP